MATVSTPRPVSTPRSAVTLHPASTPLRVMGRRPRPRRFRGSTLVVLQPMREETPQVEGRLLNVSRDGLACLVSDDAATVCRGGERIRVRFRLDAGPMEYAFQASVVYVHDAGHPGCQRIGIKFEAALDGFPARLALTAALVTDAGS